VNPDRIRVRVSWLMAAALVAAWIGSVAAGADPVHPRATDLVRFGGSTWGGGAWRLLTGAFVHAGWVHVATNALWLAVLGTVLEARAGAISTLAVLIGAAVTGAAASLAWAPYDVAVGASGAISGLAGALAVALVVARDSFAPRLRALSIAAVATWIAVCLALAALSDSVAHAAHAAGLVTGIAIGALALPGVRPLRALGGMTLALAAAAITLRVARPPIDTRARAGELLTLDARSDRILDGVGFRADGPRLARTLDAEVIRPMRVALARLVVDDRAPPSEVRFARALNDYAAARLRALELFAIHLITGDDAWLDVISAKQAEAHRAAEILDD
jgi:membrane associated rhomboid family serine protease